MTEPNKIEVLTNHIKEYVTIQGEIIKLTITKKVSSIVAKILFGFIVALLALLFIIFGSMALGYYLSTLTGSIYSGFLLVTGLYLIVGIVLLSYGKKLVINPIKNILIRQILSDEE